MAQATQDEVCPKCGMKAERRYTAIPALFGWRLDEQSHLPHHQDRLERDI